MIRIALLLLATALLAGCGSGGGSTAANDGHGLAPPSGPSTATLAVTSQAAPPDTVIYGVEFTVRLPAGVSVPADATTGETSAGIVRVSDSRAFFGARYTPASATTPATLKVNIVDSSGFTAGDLATISCTIAAGTTVSTAAFSLDSFSARGADGAMLPGITPCLIFATQ